MHQPSWTNDIYIAVATRAVNMNIGQDKTKFFRRKGKSIAKGFASAATQDAQKRLLDQARDVTAINNGEGK